MADEEELHAEQWVYLGEYDGSGFQGTGKRVYGWRDADGGVHYQKKPPSSTAAVGYLYDVDTSADRNRMRVGTFTNVKADDLEEIRADESHRRRIIDGKVLEAKAKAQDPDLTELLAHVRRYATRYKKMSAKAALVEMLAREVHRSN